MPSAVPTPIILGSARFRSRGRLPVLSYLHRENQVNHHVASGFIYKFIDKLRRFIWSQVVKIDSCDKA